METAVETNRDYEPVSFTGEAGEYFRIWIVNLALTIVTLGIYSAWAKVRKERYFYTNTSVDGHHFDYHANPKSILIGRLIAVAMLGLYFASGYLHPFAPFAVVIFIFLVSPWIIVRSRRFRMRVSSYRGIRFTFKPAYLEAFKAFYGAALVTVVSFGLATATANFMRNKFIVVHSGYGQSDFKFGGQHGEFVAIFWKSVGLGILVGFAMAIWSVVVMTGVMPDGQGEISNLDLARIYLSQLPLFLGYLAIGVFFQVRTRNHIWNTTNLGQTTFLSLLSVRELIWIYLSNLVAIVFSVGLLTPWAQIRLARYRAKHTEVLVGRDFETHVALQGKEGSALGDELGEAFDVELDLGF